MGDVIRSSAAVESIFADVSTALNNAKGKGGDARHLAENRLGPTVTTIDTIEGDLKTARELAAPLLAELRGENDRADALLSRTYDDVWNDVGRPAIDRWLTLIFPGGATYYADGDLDEQPQRMELLAELLDRKLHPKLPADKATQYAQRVREAKEALQVDIDAARLPAARVKLLERVRTALGRSAQAELVALKRDYKNLGMSESEIHEIIPDRPPAKKKSG